MYIEYVEFKRTKSSNWEKGYYIGENGNTLRSCFLDVNFEPIEKDEKGFRVWDSRADLDRRVQIII